MNELMDRLNAGERVRVELTESMMARRDWGDDVAYKDFPAGTKGEISDFDESEGTFDIDVGDFTIFDAVEAQFVVID